MKTLIRFFNAKTAKIRAANSSTSPMNTWTAEWLKEKKKLPFRNTQQKTSFLLMVF